MIAFICGHDYGYFYGVTSYNHFFNSGWVDPDACQYWQFETLGM